MRHTIKIYSIPLWPFVKNVFLVSLVVLTISMLLFGLFWAGFMRQFAATFSGSSMDMPMEAIQNIGAGLIIIGAVFYGIFGSITLATVTGIGAMIYNWINARGGGFELEVSLPDFPNQQSAVPDESAGQSSQGTLPHQGIPDPQDTDTDDKQ